MNINEALTQINNKLATNGFSEAEQKDVSRTFLDECNNLLVDILSISASDRDLSEIRMIMENTKFTNAQKAQKVDHIISGYDAAISSRLENALDNVVSKVLKNL